MTLKQVFIINQDLKMDKGEIVVQVAHGEVFYMKIMGDYLNLTSIDDKESQMIENYYKWMKEGLMKKVVLKATQKEMLILIRIMKRMNQVEKWKIWFNIVYDKGLTQVPADSMTCIVIEPLGEQLADHYFGHLKLL